MLLFQIGWNFVCKSASVKVLSIFSILLRQSVRVFVIFFFLEIFHLKMRVEILNIYVGVDDKVY